MFGHRVQGERQVGVAGVTAKTGDLYRALIEHRMVALYGVGGGATTRDGNVDRSIDRDIDVDEPSVKISVPAVARVTAADCDHVGADQPRLGEQGAHTPGQSGVAAAAVPADARDLSGGLIDPDGVRLLGVRARINSSDRDVDGVIQRKGRVNEASKKGSLAAVAGPATR